MILTNTEDLPATDNRFSDNVLDDNAVDVANCAATSRAMRCWQARC